ncbi:6-phosphogluconolactonase [Occultella aeris]|uniref:Glucosamine-6-phosphate deaminase 1 n=1 Tax=Occultella aeris TaxID=2761496 RepID=A0A7M4DFH5_9MICO|nr:6-phosphogluconolactonase [Occultella aeris]VZO35668.1 Glucosamine-6-phosphate deaminase 1 [Occultella aeris]
MTETGVQQSRIGVGSRVDEVAAEAALVAATAIIAGIEARGTAHVLFASAPSQEAMLAHLARDPRIDWSNVRSLHMDEYVGISPDAPQSFGRWLEDRLPDAALAGFSRLRTDGDVKAEVLRYAALIAGARLDVTCLGVGVNGHVAFNEPDAAAFDDPDALRLVELDLASRQQQVDEGLFADLAAVPSSAVTLTVPVLMSARTMVSTVLGSHKAAAVAQALQGPVSVGCPASALQVHPAVHWFLDRPAASLLSDA